MTGKCRPSLRKKTLRNVMLSNLSVTDKECISAIFERYEAKEELHGRWIDAYPDIEPNPMFMYGICSECGFEQGISKYLNYCPNCGTLMDLEG